MSVKDGWATVPTVVGKMLIINVVFHHLLISLNRKKQCEELDSLTFYFILLLGSDCMEVRAVTQRIRNDFPV